MPVRKSGSLKDQYLHYAERHDLARSSLLAKQDQRITDTPLLTNTNICATLHVSYGEATGARCGSWWRGATLIGGSGLFRSVHVLRPRVRWPASLAFLRRGFLAG